MLQSIANFFCLIWHLIRALFIPSALEGRTVQDPALKRSFEDLQATRETTTLQLAAATAASLTAWQPVFLKTFEVTRNVNESYFAR